MFVPGVGIPYIDVYWLVRDDFIVKTHPSARIYTSQQRLVLLKFLLKLFFQQAVHETFDDLCVSQTAASHFAS